MSVEYFSLLGGQEMAVPAISQSSLVSGKIDPAEVF